MILPTQREPAVAGDARAAVAERPRVFTARALGVGVLLAATVAWVTPWNDWFVHNSFLYCDFVPPAVVTALFALAVGLNPLLGRHRFRRGELALIVSLLLAVGGFASSGFARYWSIVVAGPARRLARAPYEPLKALIDAPTRARLLERLAARARDDFRRLDVDGDGRLTAAEAWGGAGRILRDDADGDGALSLGEYVAGRVAHDPVSTATWRYAFPPDLFLGIPEAGPIDAGDPEYRRLVDDYCDGAGTAEAARVAHGALVTWRDAAGVVHEREPAWGGATREEHPRVGAVDLEDDLGRALAGARAGQEVDTAAGRVAVIAVEPAPLVPARAWLRVALAWSPLVLGVALASVAGSFVVRRQWTDNERLPYPISTVFGSLIDEPEAGRRLPAIARGGAFRAGFGVALFVVVWRGLYDNHLLPVTITTSLDLRDILAGRGVDGVCQWAVQAPHLYFTFFGLAFLTTLEISFGLWFYLLAMWAITAAMRSRGSDVDFHIVKQVGYGSWSVVALLVLWLGRTHYWRVACAAVGWRSDPAARAAAPWLWALLAGLALIAAWLTAHGAPVGAAIAVTLALFAFLLVIARGIAEAGIPIAVFPEAFNPFLHSAIGASMPITALMPLAIIGMVLGDPREALMPYATTAAQLGARAEAPERRFGAVIVVMSVVGAAIACASMVWFAYHRDGHTDWYTPYAYEMNDLDWRCAGDPGRAAQVAAARGRDLSAMGLGALLTALLGVLRMALPWWPLHPLPLAFALCYTSESGWCSFLIAWAVKLGVMRYGGVAVYRRLVPAAVGLIAGESLGVCAFTLVKVVVTGLLGYSMPAVNALPG